MDLKAFEIRVPAKWVLAGEHSVLRGAEAVVMPCHERSLSLSFRPSTSGRLEIHPPEAGPVLRELFAWLESKLEGRLRGPFPGAIRVESTIPAGAGLGSSAAVSVALARLIEAQGLIGREEGLEIAARLEDHFHGRSSGMDVAAVGIGEPIVFSARGGALPLRLAKIPRFTLHDTGIRSSTRECVGKVARLALERPDEMAETDRRMGSAAARVRVGLKLYSEGRSAEGLDALARAMAEAQSCFEVWRLLPQEARIKGESLLSQGALGVKITGAGGGGFLVALWPD